MKSEKLTSFALMIAAIALLAVGAMSYRDYLKAKYEKEFGVSAAATGQAAPQPPPGTPQRAQGQITAVEAPAPPPQPVANPISPAPPPAPATAEIAAPDPRISQYQENLEALRLENALYREKLEEAKNGGDPVANASPARNPNTGLPASAVAAAQPPSPELRSDQTSSANTRQEVSALEEKVRKEASVAKVVEFDSDWAFVVLDGGRNRGIEHDMRFAVRRGGEILGWIKITEVEENRAVANLMSQNKDSQTARKPAPGDDIIAFNLF